MPILQITPSGSGTPATTVTDETAAAGTATAAGSSANYAREDHTHGTQSLALAQAVLSANFTIPANNTSYVVDNLEIANGINLEIANTGALEIG